MFSIVGWILAKADLFEAREAMTWLVGSVGQAGTGELRALLAAVVILLPAALLLARPAARRSSSATTPRRRSARASRPAGSG